MMPAMSPMPSMSASSSATATGGEQGGAVSGMQSGDWNINFGSGDQGVMNKWVMIAAAVTAVVLVMKRKKAA